MALFEPSAIVGNIRGKLGGAVFTNSKSGPVIRSWRKPKDSANAGQRTRRAEFSVIVDMWLNTLTPAQRAGWDALAGQAKLRNSLGLQFAPTGREFFIRSAIWLRSIGQSVNITAPSIPFPFWPQTAISEAAGPIIQLSLVGDASGFAVTLIRTMISPPLPATINHWYGPWAAQETSFWPASGTPVTIITAPNIPSNARYFLQATPMTQFNAIGFTQEYTIDVTLA